MEKLKIKSSRLQFIDLLYIMGAAYVVLGHSTINYVTDWGAPNLRESSVATLINKYIYSFHMPLFFFISGFVYKFNISKRKYIEFKPFLVSKFNRLMVPYLLVGILYVSVIKLIQGQYQLDNFISSVYKNIFLGFNPSQLWFLLCLFSIFIIYFHLRKIVDKYINNIFINLIIFWTFFYFYCFFDLGKGYFQIDKTLDYLIYFHLGYITFAKRNLINLSNKDSILLFITHIIFFIISRFAHIPLSGFINSLLGIYSYFAITKTIIDVFPNISKMRIYTLLRKHNLDIYLYHQQIILLLISSYKFRSLNPFLVVIISFFVSIIISIFIAKIIESIKMAKLITK